MMLFMNMIGIKYNKLTAIRQVTFIIPFKWEFQCECGNTKILVGSEVRRGKAKSCGCLIYRNRKRGEAAFNILHKRIQRQARERGYSWNLSEDNVREITSKSCHYCGNPPSYISGNETSNFNGTYIYNGIDRKDNTIGYDLNNCVPCCGRCNRAKDTLDYSTFREWIRKINHNWARF